MNWRFEHQEALLLLVLAAAVVALHLARRRPRPLLVPFLAIWDRSGPDSGGGFKKLRNLLLLTLSLSALAAVAAALADPHRPPPETVHVLLLLDDSASMDAQDADGGTRFEKARDDLARAVSESPPHAAFALGLTAGKPSIVLPFGTRAGEVAAAIRSFQARPLRGDAPAALKALAPHVEGRSNASVWIATDAALSSFPPQTQNGAAVHARRYGNRSDNARVSAFSGAWGGWWDSEASIYVRVENSGESRGAFDFAVSGNGIAVIEKPLTLAPGEHFETVIPVTRAEKPVMFEGWISPGGALSADDRAWCLVPKRERKRLLLVGADFGPFVQSALEALSEDLDPAASAVASPATWRAAARDGDVLVFEGSGPGDRFPPGGSIVFDPDHSLMPSGAKLGEAADATVTSWDRSHPVTRGLSFENVYFRKFRPLGGEYHPLVSTEKGTIVGVASGPGGPAIVISAPLKDCNLALTSAFPLLVRNAIRWVGQGGSAGAGPGRCSYCDPTGAPDAGAAWVAGKPGGPGVAVEAGNTVVYNFFDAAESCIAGSRIEGGPWPVAVRRPPESRPWPLLAATALALLLMDWVAFAVLAKRAGPRRDRQDVKAAPGASGAGPR